MRAGIADLQAGMEVAFPGVAFRELEKRSRKSGCGP
jgi:hypothetical protein